MLVAQAIEEGLILLTADQRIRRYGAKSWVSEAIRREQRRFRSKSESIRSTTSAYGTSAGSNQHFSKNKG